MTETGPHSAIAGDKKQRHSKNRQCRCHEPVRGVKFRKSLNIEYQKLIILPGQPAVRCRPPPPPPPQQPLFLRWHERSPLCSLSRTIFLGLHIATCRRSLPNDHGEIEGGPKVSERNCTRFFIKGRGICSAVCNFSLHIHHVCVNVHLRQHQAS
jgi:hypothetical protein